MKPKKEKYVQKFLYIFKRKYQREKIMFGFLKKKENDIEKIELPPLEVDGEKEIICAPMEGETVSSSEISDLTFQKEMLGKSVAIRPTEGKMYAPADGKINMLIETLHAVSMTTERGAEILIHVGIDTVALKGKYFKPYVKEGSPVKRGDLLLEFDIEAITAAGYEMISPVIICNTDDYADIECVIGRQIQVGSTIMKLKK